MKSSHASKIISGILLSLAILILLSLLIILPSTALAQLESFITSIQNPSTISFWTLNDLTVQWVYSSWFIVAIAFCIYEATQIYNLFLKQATYEIRQKWLSFNSKNDPLYTSKETMPCTYHQENVKKPQYHQPHKQVNSKKQPQLHPVHNKKKEEDEQAVEKVEIKAPATASLPSATISKTDCSHENTVDPIEWTVVTEKSSKKKKKTKSRRNNTQANNISNKHAKDKSPKTVKSILPTTTVTTTGTTTSNSIPKKKTKNTTNNNNNIKVIPNTKAPSFAATAAAATVVSRKSSNENSQTEMKSFQHNKQETLESVSNSSEDENQPDVPFLSDNESSGSESPCSTHNSLPPPLLQDEPSYYSPFSTGFDFGVCTVSPSLLLYNEEQEWSNTTRHQHQWESGFLRPLYHTSPHKTSLLHLLNQSDKVETTITSESFRYFDDMVMSNTLYSSPLQKSRVPRDWDSALLKASHHH